MKYHLWDKVADSTSKMLKESSPVLLMLQMMTVNSPYNQRTEVPVCASQTRIQHIELPLGMVDRLILFRSTNAKRSKERVRI